MTVDLKDKESRNAFALSFVQDKIRPSQEAQGDLPERRKKNYSIYRNEKGSSGQQDIAPNYIPFHVPLVQPRVDIIAGALYQRFTSVDPMVQCIPLADTSTRQANEVERMVQAVFERSGFDLQFPLGAQTAAVCGMTLFRLYPEEDRLCVEANHPDWTMAYPAYQQSAKKLLAVGHSFQTSVAEIEAMSDGSWEADPETGVEKLTSKYFPGCADGLTGKPLTSDEIPGSPLIARTQPESAVVKSSDLPIKAWECHSWEDIEGDKDEQGNEVKGLALYRIVVTEDVPRLLAMERLTFSRPWYFDGRLHTEWGGFYPEGCIAQNLQGMQHLYTDLHNAAVAGSYAAMSPKVILSGGVLGEKTFRMGFGDVFQANGPINVSVIPSGFNPGVLPLMIQEVDAKADSIARVSRISQNRQLKGRTTKAEAEMLYSQGEDSEVQYAAHFSRPVAEMAEFIVEFAREHPDYMARNYPEAPVSPEALHGNYRYEVSGRTQTNLPGAQVAKYQDALGVATTVNQAKMALQQPPVYDEEKIGDAILEAMELNISTENLKYDDEPDTGLMGQPGVLPEMGGNVGFPGMGGGAPGLGGLQSVDGGLAAGM